MLNLYPFRLNDVIYYEYYYRTGCGRKQITLKVSNSGASLIDAHETRFGIPLRLRESRTAEVPRDTAAVSLRS